MTLAGVLDGVRLRVAPPVEILGAAVAGLEYDSRRVDSGFLFFAFIGTRDDGRKYAREALTKGAVAVVSGSPAPDGFPGAWIEVEDVRRALALASRNFYRRAAEKVAVTGITGTNGKTTTTFLADSVLRSAGLTTAMIGTIEYRLAGERLEAVNTTPESLDLYRIFDRLLDAGGSHATMEVSSHALALGRVHGLRFHTAVFTNLTRDHLDFHGTMEDYFAAKRALFEGQDSPPPRASVINVDDPWARRIPAAGEVFPYGLSDGAGIRARNISAMFEGVRFDLEFRGRTWPVRSALAGTINVYNLLAAFGAGVSLGLDAAVVVGGLEACRAVPGRFERVEAGQPFAVIVDYAHTPDAIRNALAAARALEPRRLITVFGCGGDRDRAKRPLMGEAAAESSDFVVLTSDNPRGEDPLAIMNDALVGLRRHDAPHALEPDRRTAIRLALSEAREGDLVLIAGKGHERTQTIAGRAIPFDDREVAASLLAELGYRGRKA
jgi:UDP-N-acetylmuramoyl-L-alanyl-D-glutamate--2,6-diaminopimelate ligase